MTMTFYNHFRERLIGFCAAGSMVVVIDRLSEGRTFRKPHVAWDDHIEYIVGEMPANFRGDLVR